MSTLHPVVERVTARIAERSKRLRGDYLARMDAARETGPARRDLGCGNLAHGFAAAGTDKQALRSGAGGNIGIVTAYNDMLSAHQPMEQYPALIRMAARNAALDAEVSDLKEGLGAIEERARNELGMIRHDEIFFQVLERAAGSGAPAAH